MEIDLEDETAAHLILAPIAGRGEESKELNAWIDSVYNAREAAERKRLFYVACTRAREELHLFAASTASASGGFTIHHDSLLRSAWPAAQIYFTGIGESPSTLPHSLPNDHWIDSIAATAEESERPPILHRLPSTFDPNERWKGSHHLFTRAEEPDAVLSHFVRPEGSFVARAFGNAVHTFIEGMARRLATGQTIDVLRQEVPDWTSRITAVLRGEGLSPAIVKRSSTRVRIALETMLRDKIGQWILAAHDGADSEVAMTFWQEKRMNVRLDRIFLAGPEPLTEGHDHLWIVDFKTTTHGRDDLDAFLLKERETYAQQMAAYAHSLTSTTMPKENIRLMLYYPLIPVSTWWKPE